jgi:hypothetical protein
MKRILTGTTLVFWLAVIIHAQASLTGRWQGETVNRRPVTLDLKAEGSQLTGTITLVKEPAAISDGRIDKNTFSFKATVEGKTATFTGENAGDEVTLLVEGAKNRLILKRMK